MCALENQRLSVESPPCGDVYVTTENRHNQAAASCLPGPAWTQIGQIGLLVGYELNHNSDWV